MKTYNLLALAGCLHVRAFVNLHAAHRVMRGVLVDDGCL